MFGFDWTLPAHLYTDTSGYGMGLVLTQKGRGELGMMEVPILYDSTTLNPAQRHYPPYKRELLAIITFCHKY